jgi:hypothetical protein
MVIMFAIEFAWIMFVHAFVAPLALDFTFCIAFFSTIFTVIVAPAFRPARHITGV